MGLRDMLMCFVDSADEVIFAPQPPRFDEGTRAGASAGRVFDRVANIDEVIRLIRASPDAAAARTALMAVDWPAGEVAALLALIDDSGNVIINDRVRLTEVQARGILDLRLQRLTGLERERSRASSAKSPPRSPNFSTSSPAARAAWK